MRGPILLLVVTVGCLGAPQTTEQPGGQNEIVGGEIVSIKKVPYQLALEEKGRNICGASIISEYWALTAAHCVYSQKSENLKFRSGSDKFQKGGVLHQVVKIVVHEKFGGASMDYDMALLRVKNPFQKKDIISLAKDRPATGENSTVSGWGHTAEGGSSSEQLRWVFVPIFDQKKCNALHHNGITDRMLCAGFPDGGKDSCQGDSGGPLVVRNSLAGIVSWGYGCARKTPGVYANVAAVHNWIVDVIKIDIVDVLHTM